VYISAYIYMCVSTYIYVCMCYVCVSDTLLSADMRAYTCVCVYVCVCMCVCVYGSAVSDCYLNNDWESVGLFCKSLFMYIRLF